MGTRTKMPPPSLSGRGGVGEMGGEKAYLTSLLLGPKSTDPNLEAEAPSVAVWLENSCAPRKSALLHFCLFGGVRAVWRLAASLPEWTGRSQADLFLLHPARVESADWRRGLHRENAEV